MAKARFDERGVAIEGVEVSAYKIPTDQPESDGTLEWDSTTIVVVEVDGGGKRGIGYTYTHAAAAKLAQDKLAEVVKGRDAMAVEVANAEMVKAVRNFGRPGLCANAISAVDAALWDLKAKLLYVPLVTLLGAGRESVPVYGSGGFTSYSLERLQAQLGGWVAQGIRDVKMKVGRSPDDDLQRARVAREAIGNRAALMVDANGAYRRKQALKFSEEYARLGVVWFEEPVSSDDLEGLRLLRDRAPAPVEIAAGEYGYEPFYFRRMLDAGAVDVLQADGTRCGGITGFLEVADLCQARGMPISAHTAPSFHLHACLATSAPMRPLEYFHDHVRIEEMLFDGAAKPVDGALRADLSRPGLGIELKRKDAKKYEV